MAPLASHHTTGEAPADYGDSDSYIGGFQASRKMDEATRHQAPGISASDERCKEKPSIARSRSTNTGCVGLGSSKTRRKSTGSILACISALQCLLTGSTDPNSGPPYVERFRPLNKPPHFQNQLKLALLNMQFENHRMLMQDGTGPRRRKRPRHSRRYLQSSQPMTYPAKHLCRSTSTKPVKPH